MYSNRRFREEEYVSDFYHTYDEEQFELEDDFTHDAFNALYPVVKKYKRLMDNDPLVFLRKQIEFITDRLDEVL